MNPTLTAALIAGGKSSRMGRDKALLEWNGRPLWHHQLEVLLALDPTETLICRGEQTLLPVENVRQIPDLLPNRGPLGAIATALAAAPTSHVVFLAIDLPRITSDFLKSLCAQITPATGIVPRNEYFYEGLAAIYPTSLAGLAAEVTAAEDHSLQAFVRQAIRLGLVEAVPLAESEGPLFANLNTPKDVKSAGS